jgi:hypothetical protein
MSSSSADLRSTERRRFLKLVGFASISTAVGAAMSSWAEPRPVPGDRRLKPPPPASTAIAPVPATRDTGRAAAADTTRAAAPKPPEISEDARALAGVIQRRYGEHLDAKQLEAVTEEINFSILGGKRLRERKLANSDEPDFTFRA